LAALVLFSFIAFKSLALSLKKPLIAVHHMQAHVLANLIDDPRPSFPFLCLTVSGGHTQIVQCNSPSDLIIIGQTIDDAAGEAFDKISKLLGLPYPGGPVLDKLAQLGNPKAFEFAKPMVPELNYSFSGLKTSVLYFLQKQDASFIEATSRRFLDTHIGIQSRFPLRRTKGQSVSYHRE
jgi:N6-L-threonylcarbamoyladenine synthase